MYNIIKKIEYCIAVMIYEDVDIHLDNQYNIKFIKESDHILMELGVKLNYDLKLSDIFKYKKITPTSYIIYTKTNIDKIIDDDKEELFVARYKNHLQPSEKMLLYLSIDNDNNYIYEKYKTILKNTIQSLT